MDETLIGAFDQDCIPVWFKVVYYADNFKVELLNLRAGKNGKAIGLHFGFYFIEADVPLSI